ncbi:endonuclease domain-containing 1 protein [Xenopus laevis]|uniref:Endonuclease domain-containing 1 protein n=1 Tax=Xenopus laevis TaxID=8355 RepID=A0A8J0UND4_XENLA|nr:endonuclease domain-containing 1 protein [Xenopus laevis]
MKMMLSLGWLFIAIVHTAEPLISDNFSNCRDYFYKEQLPQGFDGNRGINSLAYICQQYGNTIYFASLYDRDWRIPLYSAYILDRRNECLGERKHNFDIEPQLIELNHNMQSESEITSEIPKSQAVNADYEKTGYHRGHLNPVCHHETQEGQDATFTLTNVVPMNSKLNIGKWRVYEANILKKAEECTTMYVVTGIVPGNNWLYINRVNIPSYVWNAYCCVGKDSMPIKSGAGIVENYDNKPVNEMKINELQEELKKLLMNKGISIFQNNCELQHKRRRVSRNASSMSGHLQPSPQAP